MKQSKNPQNQSPRSDWQLLGQLKLPVGSIPDELIMKWLSITLESLSVTPELFEKMKRSVKDVASRLFESPASLPNFDQGTLSIYIPRNIFMDRLPNRCWGFFRIEKIDAPVEDKTSANHSIEFYLYLEG